MATTRLRKTFHYPSEQDGSDDELPEAMDEEGNIRISARLPRSDKKSRAGEIYHKYEERR